MVNIICSELIKLKKSFIIPLIIVSAVFIPSVIFISNFGFNYSNVERHLSAIDIVSNIDIFQIQFLNALLFPILAGYMFSKEFTNKTANILYSYPVSRIKIFFCKSIVTYGLIITIYLINFVCILCMTHLTLGFNEVKNIFIIELKIYAISLILQILLMPVSILIGVLSKNILFPAIFGILSAVTSMFMMIAGVYMQLSPIMIPSMPIYYFLNKDPIDFIAVILSGATTFIVSLIADILYLKNCDIN